MKNYHSILEVPKDASKEQIRARYKQLVRIFHPDRYSDPKDKQFVEERMREINEAYNALVNPVRPPLRDGNEALPQPVVLPPNGLDFGNLPWGSDQTLTFHVGNVGGNVRRFKLGYSEENSWFRVTEGSRVHANKPFPLRFGVAVDTHALEPGKNYHGWIDINMDEVTTRINLHVHVVTMRAFVWLTPRLATVLGLLLLGLILTVPQMLDFNTPIFSQNRPAASSSIAWQQDQAADDESAQRAVAVGPRLSSGSESLAGGAADDLNQSGADVESPPHEDSSGDTPTATASATSSSTATPMINTPTAADSTPVNNMLTPPATVVVLQSQPTAIPIEPPRGACGFHKCGHPN
ncbi:MAG: J domain-containing protein [Caldilineaceae bacterium]